MVTAGVGVAHALAESVLGGDDEAIALGGDELADIALAGAVGVVVGGVDEVAAGLDERLKYLAALVLRRAPTPILAEGHRAEAHFRDTQAAAAEQFVVHAAYLSCHQLSVISYQCQY